MPTQYTSLTDVANNIVAWVVVRLSAMPADREHPYGHRKFETLAVFALATLLAVLAFEIAKNAVTKESTEIISGNWELAVMITVLVINIALATWQRYWAKKLKSSIMLADAAHTFADVLTTVVVIYPSYLKMQVHSTSIFIQSFIVPSYRGRPCASLPTGRRQGALAGAEASRFALNKNRRTRLWLPASLYRLLPWSRLNPAFSSSLGIVGWQLSTMGYLILDRLCALGVTGFVLYLAYRLFKTAFPVLVDEYAIDPEDINKAVINIEGVKEVGRIRSRWIGSDVAIDMVVSVDAKLTTEESHKIADKIETMIEAQFNVGDAFIHIEPYK